MMFCCLNKCKISPIFFLILDVPRVELRVKLLNQTSSESPLEIHEGEKATLKCRAESKPIPHTIHWIRNVTKEFHNP